MICSICKLEHEQAYTTENVCVRALLARLAEWEDFFQCESPHDAFVMATSDPWKFIGKEQRRANLAENKLIDLYKEMGEL